MRSLGLLLAPFKFSKFGNGVLPGVLLAVLQHDRRVNHHSGNLPVIAALLQGHGGSGTGQDVDDTLDDNLQTYWRGCRNRLSAAFCLRH